jgi:endo-1,4-beta-xylanase
MTPENAMKMGPIHPFENQYNWLVRFDRCFAKRNHLKLRGIVSVGIIKHPAGFLLIPRTGKQVTKEVLLQRLKDHITTVVSRYKGTIMHGMS